MLATRDCCPLPEDLIIEILLRLPVKSLLRFRSVCRLWNIRIRSPSFIQNHFHQESNPSSLLVYWSGEVRRNCQGREFDLGENFIFDPVSAFTLVPDETLGRDEDQYLFELGLVFSLRGPCNGVFCVLDCDKLALWSPATRSLRRLPQCRNISVCDIGFGIDPFTDEFKVVLIQQEVPGSNEFALYRSTCDSWVHLQDEALADVCCHFEVNNFGPTFSNGFFYWIRLNRRISKYVILSFDMHDEVFQEIDIPEILNQKVERKIDWFGDSLALLAYHDGHVALWLMKELGRWTKLFTVSLSAVDFISVRIWRKNQILASTSGCELILYDLNSHRKRNLVFRSIENATTFDLYAYNYKESLVSV